MSCDKCGLTYNQFVNSDRLGCDKCYDYFGKDLILLRRVGNDQPYWQVKRSGSQLRHKRELKAKGSTKATCRSRGI